jgi:hypothetical protein
MRARHGRPNVIFKVSFTGGDFGLLNSKVNVMVMGYG